MRCWKRPQATADLLDDQQGRCGPLRRLPKHQLVQQNLHPRFVCILLSCWGMHSANSIQHHNPKARGWLTQS